MGGLIDGDLVGGWTNPFEKYARQIGFIFPKVRGENKKCLKFHHPVIYATWNPDPRYEFSQIQGMNFCFTCFSLADVEQSQSRF